ncbi:glycosyltransferase family 25 protein [Fuscovulum blasticum]|uniref:glycosyltransferase family 25 protein n=1 Tax=Fuscovulum blasticum TaxID=1075 RepID=UPI001D17D37A|nr:glycosyltransferase family 25 protein [Fuscovulum blasticum]
MSRPPVPIFVISLTRATERRARIAAEFAQAGLDYTLFDGIDGRAEEARLLAQTDLPGWHRFMGGPISAGHMGCYASHVALWAQIGAGPDPVVLICEDDVTFDPDFPQALQAALDMADGWDICRFARLRAKGALTQRRQGKWRLNAYWGRFTGNACYLIKRDLAARLAREFWPIRRAHDHELNRFFAHDFRLMGLEPFTARPEDRGESYITGTAMAEATKFPALRRLPHYAHKAANYLRRIAWLIRHRMLPPPRS